MFFLLRQFWSPLSVPCFPWFGSSPQELSQPLSSLESSNRWAFCILIFSVLSSLNWFLLSYHDKNAGVPNLSQHHLGGTVELLDQHHSQADHDHEVMVFSASWHSKPQRITLTEIVWGAGSSIIKKNFAGLSSSPSLRLLECQSWTHLVRCPSTSLRLFLLEGK